MTKHTCATCRWWLPSVDPSDLPACRASGSVQQFYYDGVGMVEDPDKWHCSEHSALQRERERLRIAGEVIAALAPIPDEVRHHVALAYEYADALLAEHERTTQ